MKTAEIQKKLECATSDTLAELGIGGYVKACDFGVVFAEIDAELFAKIMYATERMIHDFDGNECFNAMNIPPTIEKDDYTQKLHFGQVADIFRKHFGNAVVSLR